MNFTGRVSGTFQEPLCAFASLCLLCVCQILPGKLLQSYLVCWYDYVCVRVCACLCMCACVYVCECRVFMAFLSLRFRFVLFFFLYCLLQVVKIHIEDHSVSSRVILRMEGWMEGWMTVWEGASNRSQGEGGGGGQVAMAGGAPRKIPIDWLINQKALKAS